MRLNLGGISMRVDGRRLAVILIGVLVAGSILLSMGSMRLGRLFEEITTGWEANSDQREQEARQAYEEARQKGDGAALMEQTTPNIFANSVANILPGQEIQIEIRYLQALTFQEGQYRFVFPMVVSPRYALGEGEMAETLLGAVPEAIRRPYLPPRMRRGDTVTLQVDLDAGVPLCGFDSPSHDIVIIEEVGESRWSKGVASSSLFCSSTAAATGGASGPSKAVLYFQMGGVGRVPTGTRERWSSRRGCQIHRGFRERSEEQPLSDLESHVVRDVLPPSGQNGGDTEKGRRCEESGHSDSVGSSGPDGGQVVPGAGGGAKFSPRLLWLSAKEVRTRCSRSGQAAMLAE